MEFYSADLEMVMSGWNTMYVNHLFWSDDGTSGDNCGAPVRHSSQACGCAQPITKQSTLFEDQD
jgi:hypothetical protein